MKPGWLFAFCGLFFNRDIGEGYAGSNPALRIEIGSDGTRDTILATGDQYADLFKALDYLQNFRQIPDAAADAIRVLAPTGARRNEIAGLRWNQVDLKQGLLVLPLGAHKTGRKTGKPRSIALNSAAKAIIAARKQDAPKDYVFPPSHGDGPITLSSRLWALIRKQINSSMRHAVTTNTRQRTFDMEDKPYIKVIAVTVTLLVVTPVFGGQERDTRAFFGDTHLHTAYSPDAYLMGNQTTDPDTAYNYAKGLPVVHPLHRARIQIGTPLDFLVVSDHAEFMGVIPKILQGDPLVADTETGKRYSQMFKDGKSIEVFSDLIAQVNGVIPVNPELSSDKINRGIWGDIMDSADRHNEPGEFTAFMGWEWSSTPNGANLHRVIIMREGKDKGEQFIPYNALDSDEPEDLWHWLDATSEKTGANFIAIPHNSNISKGLMFPLQDSAGKMISRTYAETRMRWEPLVEVTQIKGDSETHPNLSPTDEFADYETYDHLIEVEGNQQRAMFSDGFLGALSEADRQYIKEHKQHVAQTGDYARSALKRGLVAEDRIGVNPYKFGMIGSTDSHTAMASAEENNFHGKMALDSIPENKSKEIVPGTPGWDMGAAGLVAIYAEQNTRESLFEGMQRKEVYATTGPHIQLRFFGGWSFQADDISAADMVALGYQKGVPMGGDLSKAAQGKAPIFMISALKDPVEANLDRIQVVKGWLGENGKPEEKVFNVALSDDRKVGSDGKAAPVGNTVDIKTGKYLNNIGDAQISTLWTDPEFDPTVSAFYYVRVLQIPTPRHTLFDAIALGIDAEETGRPTTIQERAYSSPIWYTP